MFFWLLFHPIKPIRIAGLTIQGVFPKKQLGIAKALGQFASEHLISLKDLQEKATDTSIIDRLMPFIDKNVEHFLRIKLAEKMPMISMFIGDATIAELKSIFIEELQILFPELMKLYVEGLLNDIDIEHLITKKVSGLSSERLELVFRNTCKADIQRVGLVCGLIGFLVGLLQLLIVILALGL